MISTFHRNRTSNSMWQFRHKKLQVRHVEYTIYFSYGSIVRTGSGNEERTAIVDSGGRAARCGEARRQRRSSCRPTGTIVREAVVAAWRLGLRSLVNGQQREGAERGRTGPTESRQSTSTRRLHENLRPYHISAIFLMGLENFFFRRQN